MDPTMPGTVPRSRALHASLAARAPGDADANRAGRVASKMPGPRVRTVLPTASAISSICHRGLGN